MKDKQKDLFICFSAKDRYTIAEPIVYHLNNYGIDVWYDRNSMVMGDNRIKENINTGVEKCKYAIIILSANTIDSICATEEIHILKHRYSLNNVIIFPVLYELAPNKIPIKFKWIKELIFKETSRNSGTREVCNHIACKITNDIKMLSDISSIDEILKKSYVHLPKIANDILSSYLAVDTSNLNARVALLYATYIVLRIDETTTNSKLVNKIFERLFSETKLNLSIDYRELWILENAICILANDYKSHLASSKI